MFEYVTTDGNTSNLSSTLTVTINGINDDPIIVDTLGGTAIDIIFITLDELTSKDTLLSADDIDDLQSVLTWEIIEEDPANPETGTAELDEESGVLTYTTEFNFFENTGDTLTARVCDDGLGCDTVLVIVSIIDVNDPPVALNDTMCTSYFASVEIDVLANDIDPDGKIDLDSTSVTIESYPENGDLDIDPVTGVVTFSPYEGFWGDDEFQYIVYDKFGVASNVATVKLCVGERPPLVPSEGITPNNDGKNDSWWIENIQYYSTAEVEVYNRWGNLVWQQSCCYDNNDSEKRWNGESNIGAGSGGQVPDGSYYFVIRSSDGDVESFTGFIVKN